MQYPKRNSRIQGFARKGGAGALLIGALLSPAAFAAGTTAGDTVSNTVTLGFDVGGSPQADVTATVAFDVDRKYDVDVVQSNSDDYVTVTAGQTFATNDDVAALVFEVTNESNDDADVLVGLYNQAGTLVTDFTSSPTGASFAGVGAVGVAIDLDSDGLYDDTSDTVLTPTAGVYSLGTLAEDATVRLVVAIDVPAIGVVDADDYSSYTLVAAVGTAGAGVALAADDSGNEAPWNIGGGSINPNTAGIESVFVDDGGATADDEMFDFTTGAAISSQDTGFDVPGAGDRPNGQHSDTSGFVVVQPALLVGKYVEVLYDPISGQRYDNNGDAVPGANEPKSIPGAVMMYVSAVRNNELAGTGFSAANVTFTTDLADGPEIVDEGVPAGYPAINLPSVVNLNVADDPITPTVTVAVTVDPSAIVTDTDTVTAGRCDATNFEPGYSAGTVVQGADTQADEIDANIGTCDPTEEGFVVYFVTVQ